MSQWSLDPVGFARQAEALGAGEIVMNNIDRDGEMGGYDLELIRQVREAVHLPVTVLGGAGSLAHIEASLLGPGARWRVLLVTSAWHLRRAVALFEQEGFAVQPVGADDRSFPSCRGLRCWVPSAGALEDSGLALKEVLGYAVQVRAWPGSRLPGRDDGCLSGSDSRGQLSWTSSTTAPSTASPAPAGAAATGAC